MLADPYSVVPFTVPAKATVNLPGSKSITNRAMLLAALANGKTTISGALFSEDTEIMAGCLRQLGFDVEADEETSTIAVVGNGGTVRANAAELNVGTAGTAARFLTALCALAAKGNFKLDGTPAMRRRPMHGLLDALGQLGAKIRSDDRHFPIEIDASGLGGGLITLDARESSQLLSALLMVAPLARDAVRIKMADSGYRREYVSMTLRMMEQFGQPATSLSSDGINISPPAGTPYRTGNHTYRVEPDASAASYFLALPLVTGGRVYLSGIGRPSLQGDAAFADRLADAGAQIEESDGGTTSSFDRGNGRRIALRENFHAISDTFLTLAAIAPLLEGETHISGIAHTRKQESDRVSAMATELRRIGQEVVEEHDAITIKPRPLQPADIDTYKDHRFAMSFAILGCHDLNGDGTPWLRINDPGCCAKTFPLFFEELEAARKQSLA